MDPAPIRETDFSDDSTEKMPAPGSSSITIQAENTMLQAAQQARHEDRDPSRMLRVLAVLSAPVFDPVDPDRPPTFLDLHQEWHVLAEGVRQSKAPILLARLRPPTLDSLRSALSPRTSSQEVFPQILHFSGHAWREGLLLEDELGQVHPSTTSRILEALKGIAQPLDLVVLNGCESAADARSVAQALVEGGMAKAVVGHERPVLDTEAVSFAARLYSELTGGFPLKEAVRNAQREVTTHEVILIGDESLVFSGLTKGEPVVDRELPEGNLPPQTGLFLGRGRELVEISRGLLHPPKVIVIFGPPGIGKSSLVLEAGHRNAHRFPGGVAYAQAPRLEDASKASAVQMLKGLAEALSLAPEPEKLAEELLGYTAIKPTLLILDNLETLPSEEMVRLADFLRLLGGESAVIAALRPASEILEDLPTFRPLSLQQGLGLKEAARYALFLARQRRIPLDESSARLIASSVDGHPLLVEKIVAQAGRKDLEDLLEDVKKHGGDFVAQISSVYSWSYDRLDSAGKAAWAALPLFPAGIAPEGPLRAAAGKSGPMALRDAALADFDPERQVWQWHATVAEYASRHWPISPEERPSRLTTLAPAWTDWLDRLPAGERSISRIENVRLNLRAMVKACTEGHCPDCPPFLEALKQELPLPDRTLILRELIAEVCEARLKAAQPGEKEEKARRLSDLGYALSALSRRQEALIPAQEAVEIYRKLAQSNPAAFLPNLAASLNNLGNRLSALGRRQEALIPAQEAVEIYRKLAQFNSAAFLPDLALSLNNLGIFLSALGRLEEALIPAQEAVEIYRKLAQSNPAAFLPNLVAILNNLGNRLSALGRLEEALIPAQEAVDIRRKLAQSNPAAFLPDLAASLNNLGTCLSALGRREEALIPAQESVDIRRKLAQSNPAAFLPDLAMSLNNLGTCLSALGRLEEALILAQEATEIYRKLAQSNPAAFLPDLAMSLNNLGTCLSALGRLEEALIPAQEATEIYRKLAQSNPAAFLPNLAMSLGSLGRILRSLERYKEAALIFAEGLQHIAPFYRQLPGAFSALAGALQKDYLQACQEADIEPDENLLINIKE